MFYAKEFEGRIGRLSHHFLEKDYPSIPNKRLNQYKIDHINIMQTEIEMKREKMTQQLSILSLIMISSTKLH